jgi:2-C-methyl-D-erythritol 4-phosphate cytidylyltransferase
MYDALCYALVPCAGVGVRAGAEGPKQYVKLGARSVVAHTLAALAQVPRIVNTLVVLAPDDRGFERAAPGFTGWVERCGGATRAASVAAGLAALARRGMRDDDWVLVHDAARCLVSPASIERLIDACLDDPVGGLLALPLADTLKSASEEQRVAATVDRRGKWAAQTPQMFRLGLLRDALARAGTAVTDESGAVEALGHQPRLVTGDASNFKLTYAEDFARAEHLMITTNTRPTRAPMALQAARVFVHDIDAARRFYAGPVGLPLRVDGSANGYCVFSLGTVDLVIESVSGDDPQEDRALAGRFTGLSLAVDDVAASHAQLAAAGVRFTGMPEAQSWGGTLATFEDPSGNQWQVVEYPRGKA